jgi:hypothetical protein
VHVHDFFVRRPSGFETASTLIVKSSRGRLPIFDLRGGVCTRMKNKKRRHLADAGASLTFVT